MAKICTTRVPKPTHTAEPSMFLRSHATLFRTSSAVVLKTWPAGRCFIKANSLNLLCDCAARQASCRTIAFGGVTACGIWVLRSTLVVKRRRRSKLTTVAIERRLRPDASRRIGGLYAENAHSVASMPRLALAGHCTNTVPASGVSQPQKATAPERAAIKPAETSR